MDASRRVRFGQGLICLTAFFAIMNGCQQQQRPPQEGFPVGREVENLRRPPRENVQPLDPSLAESARQELTVEATGQDPISRVHAIEAERESIGADGTADYLRALNDSAPVVRYAAAMVAGELGIKVVKGTLRGMANDPNPYVRVGVRFALHRLGDYTYSHDFENLARDPDPRVRAETAMVLGRMNEASAIKILLRLRKDSGPGGAGDEKEREAAYASVRQQASEALWRLGQGIGAEDLAGLTRSHYRDDQMIGMLGLASTHDPSVRQHIRPELSSTDIDVKLVAVRAMAMLGGTQYDLGYWIAVDGTKERDPKLRVLAALALGSIGRTDLQPALRELLKDQDADVRIAAASAILQLTPPEKRPAPSNDPTGVE